MKRSTTVPLALLLLAVLATVAAAAIVPFQAGPARSAVRDNGGGTNCAACTMLIGIMEQMALIHNDTIKHVVETWCNLMPAGIMRDTCVLMVKEFGTLIIQSLLDHERPDDVCRKMKICTDPTCRLYPPKKGASMPSKQQIAAPAASPIDWIKELIDRLANQHEPIVDVDRDLFSMVPTLRGSSWRGKDCNDVVKQVYPGRLTTTYSPDIDHNCNGIKGKSPQGEDYEKKFCSGKNAPMGVILLGDSAGAHFSIPPEYLNPHLINTTTYKNILSVLENEFDWPHRSFSTGYDTPADVMVDSLYMRMRQRNLCNHRDYQNLGVNGARSGAMSEHLVQSIARDQINDNPALVIFELVGNDVCHGAHSIDGYTTPEQFEANVLKSLTYLDSRLPAGSHIVFVGLAHGEILYEQLHARIHPIGVNYEKVYQYLNCLYISPCWGWMNENATVRSLTTQHAMKLSAVYPKIISQHKFKNFDMAYYDFPFQQIMDIWVSRGGDPADLIEPADGFHPSQIANALMSQVFWEMLERDHPDFLPPVNPNNDDIRRIFGDQGGH